MAGRKKVAKKRAAKKKVSMTPVAALNIIQDSNDPTIKEAAAHLSKASRAEEVASKKVEAARLRAQKAVAAVGAAKSNKVKDKRRLVAQNAKEALKAAIATHRETASAAVVAGRVVIALAKYHVDAIARLEREYARGAAAVAKKVAAPKKRTRRKKVDSSDFEVVPKKRPGRKKVVKEVVGAASPKGRPGRKKKVVKEVVEAASPKGRPGRKKKVVKEVVEAAVPKKRPGRKKVVKEVVEVVEVIEALQPVENVEAVAKEG